MYNKQAMKYAVIEFGGHQYKVAEGIQLTLDRVAVEEGKSFEVEDVLLLVEDDKPVVGTPTVKDAKVRLKVIEHTRSKKILVRRFKSKSRYRKHKSHRQPLSIVSVEEISTGSGAQ